jgi:hypothetical protein
MLTLYASLAAPPTNARVCDTIVVASTPNITWGMTVRWTHSWPV